MWCFRCRFFYYLLIFSICKGVLIFLCFCYYNKAQNGKRHTQNASEPFQLVSCLSVVLSPKSVHFSSKLSSKRQTFLIFLLIIMEHIRATMYLTGVYLRPSFPRFQLRCNPRVQISFGIKVTLMAGLKATSL